MHRESNGRKVVHWRLILSIDSLIFLLAVIKFIEDVVLYKLLEVNEVLCAGSGREVGHDDWQSIQVIDCIVHLRNKLKSGHAAHSVDFASLTQELHTSIVFHENPANM